MTTLFNFIVTGVSREQIRNLSNLFVTNLKCTLANEDIEESNISKILEEHNSIEYKNTDNKSVLGSVNDLAYHYRANIEDTGNIHTSELPNIIKQLNHMPMGALEYVFAIDQLQKHLQKHNK